MLQNGHNHYYYYSIIIIVHQYLLFIRVYLVDNSQFTPAHGFAVAVHYSFSLGRSVTATAQFVAPQKGSQAVAEQSRFLCFARLNHCDLVKLLSLSSAKDVRFGKSDALNISLIIVLI